MTTTHTQPAGCDLDSLRDLIANDGFAMSFQSMGQYRAALIAAARAAQAPQGDTRQGADREISELARADQSPVAISNAELAAFHRFCDCCEDFGAGGHDVPKAMMSQLVRIGLVRPAGPGRHEATKFGDWLRDHATPAAHTCTPADERTLFKASLKETWQMVDPYSKAQPGSYAKGEQNGMIAALNTIKENFDRAAQGAGTAPAGRTDEQNASFPHCLNRNAFISDLTYQMYLAEIAGYAPTAPVSTAAATTASASGSALPCPFCGSTDEVYVGKVTYCDNCGADGPSYERDGKPVAAWNDRAPSRAADGQQGASRAALDEAIEAMKRAKKLPVWDDIDHRLHIELDTIFAALARAPLPAQADGQAVDDARDAARREAWLIANHRWSVRWRIHTKKQIEQWQMVDDGEPWGQWGDYRKVLDTAIAAQSRAQSDTTGDRNAS